MWNRKNVFLIVKNLKWRLGQKGREVAFSIAFRFYHRSWRTWRQKWSPWSPRLSGTKRYQEKFVTDERWRVRELIPHILNIIPLELYLDVISPVLPRIMLPRALRGCFRGRWQCMNWLFIDSCGTFETRRDALNNLRGIFSEISICD